jgi:hypothetical protein
MIKIFLKGKRMRTTFSIGVISGKGYIGSFWLPLILLGLLMGTQMFFKSSRAGGGAQS